MKQRKTLSAAIIGAGNIAGGFDERRRSGETGVYTHAGAFEACGDIRLRAVYDADDKKAAAFARRWGPGVSIAASLHDMLRSRYDIVSVCSPDATHYPIVERLIRNRTCRTIFVEKPAASSRAQMERLSALSEKAGINVVVNFQRRFDPEHVKLARLFRGRRTKILSVQGLYIKGLSHIGVTMIDTVRFLFGEPVSVMALRRVMNRRVGGYSYDFVMNYHGFSANVKTADAPGGDYSYHVFELDVLMRDRRIRIVNNSRTILESRLRPYAYSGVKMLDDLHPAVRATGYPSSMVRAACYLRDVTLGRTKHDENTLGSSLRNMNIVLAVQESYSRGSRKITPEDIWKK